MWAASESKGKLHHEVTMNTKGEEKREGKGKIFNAEARRRREEEKMFLLRPMCGQGAAAPCLFTA